MVAATTRTSNGELGVAADRPHAPLLQRAQQLGLQRQRHLADLVEEQRAAVGLREQARARRRARGERAAHVAEQLALEQRLRAARAQLTATNGPAGAAPAIVERARDQLLAGAALAGDQHRRVGRRRARIVSNIRRIAGLRPTSAARAGRGRSPSGRGRGQAQAAHLRAQPRRRRRARIVSTTTLELERLGQEVEGARADRRDRGLERAERGDHHDRHVGPVRATRSHSSRPACPHVQVGDDASKAALSSSAIAASPDGPS